MNTMSKTKYAAMLPIILLSGCLGMNPLLDDCGESWEILAKDAEGLTLDGESKKIQTAGKWTKGKMCFNPSSAASLSDPDSVQSEALRTLAILHCVEQAQNLGLVSNNCAESLTEPMYVGSCVVSKDECSPAGETGETGTEDTGTEDTGTEDTGTEDTGPHLDSPADLVACNGDICEVQQALIDQVLMADTATFGADGTYLTPHFASSGVQDGWAFGGIGHGNLGEALGFEDGDVVTEIAGEPVDSWTAVIDVANEALHAERIELVFVRSDRVQTRMYVRR